MLKSFINGKNSWLLKAFLLVAVVASGAAFWMAGRSKINHGLVIPENQLNFGEVWENRAFPWRLTISNPTKQDLFIRDFATSCNCLSIEPASFLVPSGGTAELHLTFNLALAPSNDVDSNSRDVNVSMVPVFEEEGSKEKGWNIHGRVLRILSFDPPKLDFGTELIRERPIPAQTVHVKANVPLRSLSAECPTSQVVVEVLKSEVNPDIFELKVTPDSGLPQGRFGFYVTIHPVKSNGERLPDVLLSVLGLMREDIRALPESLLLGTVPVGQIISETVALYSATGTDFKVGNSSSSSEDITVEPLVKTPNAGRKAFVVKTRITRLGRQEQTVEFSVTNGDGKTSRLSYQVTYVGIPAE